MGRRSSRPRDLLLGPRRYKDLLEGLPGIGTNLLADRLRELEKRGILRRTVVPPRAGPNVYELADLGAALAPAVIEPGVWGARMLGNPKEDEHVPTAAIFVVMRAMFKPDKAAGIDESYELRVDGHVFEVRVANQQVVTRESFAHAPVLTLSLDDRTLLALLRDGLNPREALAAERVRLNGAS